MGIIFKSSLSVFGLIVGWGVIFLTFSGIGYGISPVGEEVSALQKKVNAVWKKMGNKTESIQQTAEKGKNISDSTSEPVEELTSRKKLVISLVKEASALQKRVDAVWEKVEAQNKPQQPVAVKRKSVELIKVTPVKVEKAEIAHVKESSALRKRVDAIWEKVDAQNESPQPVAVKRKPAELIKVTPVKVEKPVIAHVKEKASYVQSSTLQQKVNAIWEKVDERNTSFQSIVEKKKPVKAPDFKVEKRITGKVTESNQEKYKSSTVRVNKIIFTGNKSIDDKTLYNVINVQRGKEVTFDELKAVADSVTKYYNDHGYFLARGLIPEQDFYDGTIEIHVLEGRLGKIMIGEAKRFSKSYVRKVFSSLKPGAAVKKRRLERSLVVLNELPGMEASAILQAGEKIGTTDVVVNVKEKEKFNGLLSVSNFGTENTDRCRISTQLDIRNISGIGDSIKVDVTSAPDYNDLLYGRFYVLRPIGSKGDKLHAYISDGKSEVGGIFSLLGIENKGTSWGVGISHPTCFSRKRKITYNAFFDVDDSDYMILGQLNSRDKIRKLRFGIDMDVTNNRWHDFFSFNIQQGLGETMGGMPKESPLSSRSFSKADNTFTKFTTDFTHIQELSSRVIFIVRTRGQYSLDPLVAKEQWSIGGVNSVRGYESGKFLGDSGFTLNLESHIALDNKGSVQTQLVLFADSAMVSTRIPALGTAKSNKLNGAGIGFRMNFPYEIKLFFDLGFPLDSDAVDDYIPYIQLSKGF